jgi:U3 small nucleolar RNA-associated protein 14
VSAILPGKPGKPLISFIDIDIDRRIKIDSKMFPDWFIERCKSIESYMDSEGFNTKTSVKYPIRIQPMNKTVRIQDWEDKESIDSLTEENNLVDEVRLYFEPK